MTGEENLSKREAIMEAAVKVFSEQGFYKAKVETIAEVAGIGKGTIYEYFSSKKDLFLEMVEYFSLKYINMIEFRLASKVTAVEKLEAFIDFQIEIAFRFAPVVKVFHQFNYWTEEDFCLKFKKVKEKKSAVLNLIFQKGMETGEFKKLNTNVASNLINGALMVLTSSIVMFNDRSLDTEQVKRDLLDVFLYGITNNDFIK